jgi:DNA-binding response OmpR family regulator
MARVLVVDDEPDVLLLCRLNLEQLGHEVLEAPNGQVALELVRERDPDLIVLDLMLPGIDGYDVLQMLRTEDASSTIPVLVLTAKSLQADRDRTRELGAAAFVTKPFLPDELCATVERVLSTGH